MSLIFTKPQEQPKHDLTVYANKFNTLPRGPFDQYKSLIWYEVIETLAPGDSSVLMYNKDHLPYFTLGLLSVGQLTDHASKLLSAKAGHKVTEGRSRCINCCRGPFTLLVFDIDGVTANDFALCKQRLDECGVDYLIYSSFHHGSVEKPGFRFRLIIRLAHALNVAQYQKAHEEVAARLLSDVQHGIDKTSRSPAQQQGMRATRPDLANCAFKYYRADGVCLSVDALLTESEKSYQPSVPRAQVRPPRPRNRDRSDDDVLTSGIRDALRIIPSRTHNYQSLLIYLKAVDAVVEAYELFEFWAWLDPEHQAEQQARRAAYDPAVSWSKAKPAMNVDVAVKSIHKLAREIALEVVRADPTLTQPASKEGLKYLCVYHPKHFQTLKDQLGKSNQTNEQRSSSIGKEAV